MHKSKLLILNTIPLIMLCMVLSASASYLTAKNGKLYNTSNVEVRLTGVNWFGFETSNLAPHGLWARDYHGILLQIKSLGFNCVRIPFCDAMFVEGAKAASVNDYGTDTIYPRAITEMNKELIGKKPIEMMDEIVRFATELGLVIVLDNHSREPDGYMNEKVWYTGITSEQKWIDNWVMVATRYKNNPTVIGFDLENEPHGKAVDKGSAWGTGNVLYDWNTAAQKCGNAILAVNPDALIIIEGVEQVGTTMYWWGGNLRGVTTAPIVLSKPEKLMYSAHEYGPEVFQQPWFEDAAFPGNMTTIWDNAFGFLVKNGTSPLFIGEFGIKDKASYGGKAGVWFTAFLKYMGDNFMSWTFWCFNPNSGDTGGLLSYDWKTVEQWKVDALKPYCAPLINPTSVVYNKLNVKKSSSLVFVNKVLCVKNNSLQNPSLAIYSLSGRKIAFTNGTGLSLKTLAIGTYVAFLYDKNDRVESTKITIVK